MSRSRPPYRRQFREEAVQSAHTSGGPSPRWPGSYLIAHGALSAWGKQAERAAGLRSDGLTTAELRLASKQAGILASMGRRWDAYDNALCEAFFATLR